MGGGGREELLFFCNRRNPALKKNRRNHTSNFEGVLSLIDFEIDRTYPSSLREKEHDVKLF